jgi:hypothetical protein
MKRINALLLSLTMLAVFGAGLLVGAKSKTPSTVLHVITVKWKDGATDAQKQAAIDATRKMADAIPGITNVWLKTLKVQGEANAVIAMEFKDKAAFDAYAENAAHKKWEEVYLPVRGQSTTFDATN